jgi:hypothetical protein
MCVCISRPCITAVECKHERKQTARAKWRVCTRPIAHFTVRAPRGEMEYSNELVKAGEGRVLMHGDRWNMIFYAGRIESNRRPFRAW